MKDEAYILYLEEQVRSLEELVDVLSEEQNSLSQKYAILSTKVKFMNQGAFGGNDKENNELSRLRREIAELKIELSLAKCSNIKVIT